MSEHDNNGASASRTAAGRSLSLTILSWADGSLPGRQRVTLWLTVVTLAAVLVWLAWPKSIPWLDDPVLQVTSGVALLVWQLVLWMLLLARVGRDPLEVKFWYRVHRWAAALVCLMIALHAQQFGHGLNAWLLGVFVATMVVGVLNRETLTVRSRRFWHVWMVVKVGLAATLVALTGLHVYFAFAFH